MKNPASELNKGDLEHLGVNLFNYSSNLEKYWRFEVIVSNYYMRLFLSGRD
jgi:hypothetical protein